MIGTEGGQAIAEALGKNSVLTKLDMGTPIYCCYPSYSSLIGNNDLGAEGAKEVAEALIINQSLGELRLCKRLCLT